MAWRLASSLETLRDQVNTAYPNRSKASDGTIGNAAHAAVASDHNPFNGVVTALDLTNDPAHGFDAHAVADVIRANRHPNLKYIISNRRIAGDWTNWQWRAYNGSNPHDKHIHISVGRGEDGQSTPPYDDTTKWNIGVNNVDNPPTNPGDVTNGYRAIDGRDPNQAEVDTYGVKSNSWNKFVYEQIYPKATQLRIANEDAQKFKKKLTDSQYWGGSLDALEVQPVGLETTLRAEIEALKKQLSELPPVDPDSVTITKNSLWDWFKNIFKKG